MKYLIPLLMLTGCNNKDIEIEPKFVLHQAVIYKVPKFYSLVCSGKGTIKGFGGISTYYIQPPFNDRYNDCPVEMDVEEKDIQPDANP